MLARTTLARLGVATVMVVASAPMAFGSAQAAGNSDNAHWNFEDGCAHGATKKPCKEDPQPTKGKDCLRHGNWGGINEDHCAKDVVIVIPTPNPDGPRES